MPAGRLAPATEPPDTMPRVLVIGWDGADWRILDPLLERGVLPNLQSLIGRGARAVLRSTVPTHSWAAWPSFLTGVDPADHGVYDILEARRGAGRQFPVTYRSIRERTFLQDLTAAGTETIMVNVPLTAPPPVVSGKLVAGGVLPKGRPFTHPESLAADLARAGCPFPINGMSWTTFRNRPEPFLEQAGLAARVLSYDVRSRGMIPEPPGDRLRLYIGTGGPGHIDPRRNDGASEGTQGIVEDPSWEAPLFRLFDAVRADETAALLAVCHRLPEQLVHLKAVLGIGKLFAGGIGNSAGGGCHVAQSMQSVQKGWVCEFYSACLFA